MLRSLFGCAAPAAAADKRNSVGPVAVDGVVDDGGGGGERLALARIRLNSTQHSSEPTNMGDNETLELRVPPLPPSYRFKDVILGADHSEDDR